MRCAESTSTIRKPPAAKSNRLAASNHEPSSEVVMRPVREISAPGSIEMAVTRSSGSFIVNGVAGASIRGTRSRSRGA